MLKKTTNIKKEATVLDLGTDKFCFAIAKSIPKNSDLSSVARENDIRILGVGYQKSRGIKNGAITNLEELEDTILSIISTAEKEAQKQINSIFVALPSWAVFSKLVENTINIGNIPIDDAHLNSLLDFDTKKIIDESMELIHKFPIYFTIDGISGIQAPIGMVGSKLSVTINIVYAQSSIIKNIQNCLNRNNISVDGFLSSSYVAGLATIVDEEMIAGSILIDFGSTSTTIACFQDGILIHLKTFSIGSYSITNDIATVLRTSKSHAERIKILHGVSTSTIGIADKEQILIPRVDEYGDEHIQNVSKDTLNSIVSARLEEIFDLLQNHINETIEQNIAQRIIITGGGSRISGLTELIKAKRYFSHSYVRLGKPIGTIGSHDFVQTASFSTSAGAILYCIGKFGNSGIRIPNTNKSFWQMLITWFKRGC